MLEDEPTSPLYIGYSGQGHLLSVLKKELAIRGFRFYKQSVKIQDLATAAPGHADEVDGAHAQVPLLDHFIDAMKECDYYIVVLDIHGLEEFIMKEDEPAKNCTTDSPLYYEILAATKLGITIIPFWHTTFVNETMKSLNNEKLLPDFRGPWQQVSKFNGVRYDHEYTSASFDKLEKFIRDAPGDIFSKGSRNAST